jgi:hypothetical protein
VFGLTFQFRRAAVSIAATIAGGYQNESTLIAQIEEVSNLLTACAKSIAINNQPPNSSLLTAFRTFTL